VDRYGNKLFFLAVAFIFSVTRGIYFTLALLGIGEPVTILILFELPTIFFFIMYMTLLWIWSKVIVASKRLKIGSTADQKVFRGYVSVNVIMLILWAAFVVVYYVIQEDPALPCAQGDVILKLRHQIVNTVYLWFLAAIALIFALAVVVLGFVFLKILFASQQATVKLRGSHGGSSRIGLYRLTYAVIFTFPPMFAIKSALVLWSALTNGVVPVLAFALLEFVPSLVLLYFIAPFSKADRKMIRSKGSEPRGSGVTASTKTGKTGSMSSGSSNSSTEAKNSRKEAFKSSNDSAKTHSSVSKADESSVAKMDESSGAKKKSSIAKDSERVSASESSRSSKGKEDSEKK